MAELIENAIAGICTADKILQRMINHQNSYFSSDNEIEKFEVHWARKRLLIGETINKLLRAQIAEQKIKTKVWWKVVKNEV